MTYLIIFTVSLKADNVKYIHIYNILCHIQKSLQYPPKADNTNIACS